MANLAERSGTVPVGIDLGTTYSSLAYLTPQGQPVTLPNAEGELSTPSVVLFDGEEVIVGTEALRNSIAAPDRVVQYAKRYMGDPHKNWVFNRNVYSPKDISAFILKKLLGDARKQLGPIRHAVITVPAQFSELQRQDTVEAGRAAGLERVDIIHEPVAAALCHVLGEGLWYAELANEQTVLVFDLGGGTFDLSLVKYNQKQVRVLASGGDLHLGGLDWNHAIEGLACDEYIKSSISDPRLDRESMQALSIEVELLKRSLSVRPRSKLIVQHEGRRKVYEVSREQFEKLTQPLVQRTEQLTQSMLKANKLGWAHVDAILATGGSSRMPMIRNMLQRIGGTTLNQTLSPDQSISHGAAYYAGMLLSGKRLEKTVLDADAAGRLANFRQQSVSGRSLGILVRDMESGQRVPHYLLPANTPLPCAFRQRFGTVVPAQKRVNLHIVESGAGENDPFVELGECAIDGLPENLPVSSPIEVTIRYDEQARVHVEALVISSGQKALVTITRPVATAPASKTVLPPHSTPVQRATDVSPADQAGSPPPGSQTAPATAAPQYIKVGPNDPRGDQFSLLPNPQAPDQRPNDLPLATPQPRPGRTGRPAQPIPKRRSILLEESDRPIPLCNNCGEALNAKGECPVCHAAGSSRKSRGPAGARPVSENDVPTEAMKLPPGSLQPRTTPQRRRKPQNPGSN